jgi:hypothetical protein
MGAVCHSARKTGAVCHSARKTGAVCHSARATGQDGVGCTGEAVACRGLALVWQTGLIMRTATIAFGAVIIGRRVGNA